MSAFDAYPDAEAVVCEQLATVPGTDHVGTRIPADATGTVVRVTRLGGIAPVRGRLDLARIQVEVWNADQATARDVAAECLKALHELEGTSTETAFVTAVEQDLGMSFIPDPMTNQSRYIFGVAVYLHRAD